MARWILTDHLGRLLRLTCLGERGVLDMSGRGGIFGRGGDRVARLVDCHSSREVVGMKTHVLIRSGV